MEDLKLYTATVPFEIGELLKEGGYWKPGCNYKSSYNSPCYFIPSKKYYGEGVVADWEDIVPAPTYGEVLDWFYNQELMLYINVKSPSHLTWIWSVQCIGDKLKNSRDNGYTGLITTETQYDSFQEAANDAIKTSLNYLYK